MKKIPHTSGTPINDTVSGTPPDNISGFKGVYWHKVANKWQAQIQANGKRIYLGLFASKIEAAHVYDEAAIRHFGEFASTNYERNIA